MIKKYLVYFGIACFLIPSISHAEIIDNVIKEIKTFDEWKVACDNDTMMEKIDCKISARFYNNTSSIYVQPENKYSNQVVFIIPQAIPASTVKIRVGTNTIIESQEIKKEDFGVVPFLNQDRKTLLDQMKDEEEYLYIRFTIKDETSTDGIKYITERIAMSKFKKMLDYYDSQSNLYSERIHRLNRSK